MQGAASAGGMPGHARRQAVAQQGNHVAVAPEAARLSILRSIGHRFRYVQIEATLRLKGVVRIESDRGRFRQARAAGLQQDEAETAVAQRLVEYLFRPTYQCGPGT